MGVGAGSAEGPDPLDVDGAGEGSGAEGSSFGNASWPNGRLLGTTAGLSGSAEGSGDDREAFEADVGGLVLSRPRLSERRGRIGSPEDAAPCASGVSSGGLPLGSLNRTLRSAVACGDRERERFRSEDLAPGDG